MANIPFIPLDKPVNKPLAGEFLPLDRPFNPYTGKAIPTPEEAESGLKEAYNYFRQNIFSPDVPEEWKPQPDEKFPDYAKRVGQWEKSIMSEEFPWAIGEVATPGSKIGKLPKYAGSINLQRQAISDVAKKAELEYFEKFGVKTKITHEETIHDAKKIITKFSEDPAFYNRRLEAIKAGKVPSIPEVTAHRVINAQDQMQLQEMAKAVGKGELPVEEFNLFKAQVGNRQLQVVDPLASDAGRRLSSFNIMVGKERAFQAVNKLQKLNKRQRKLLSELDLDNPVEVERFVKDLPNPKFKDYFYEFWYNSILSGIPTHVVNTASNTAWRMFQVPHRGLTGAVDIGLTKAAKALSPLIPKFKGTQQDVFMREMMPLMTGAIKGKPKAAKRAWDVVRHGRIQEAESKWAAEMGSTLGAWDRAPNAIMRGVGKVITVPTKGLRAMDVYANTLSYDAQMGALAKRSWLQGKRIIHKGDKKFETYKDYQRSFRENPPKWAHEESMKHAKYSTFMDDPGPISEWIIQGREKVPGLRLVIPFVNTIGNLVKRGAEMTPFVGMAMYRGRKPAEVIAKQIEGGIIGYLAYHMAEQGKIVGDIPSGKNERLAFYREGKKPWSIKVGDNYVQYRRVEPFNMPLASTAIFHDRITEAYEKLGEGEEFEKVATKAFGNLANDWSSYLLESSYLSGVSDWMSKHGDKSKIPTRLGASMVPFSGFWRSINRSVEAGLEGTAKVYEHRDMLNSFAQVIPGLYALRQPRLNVWGKPVELEGGVFRHWLPYKWSKATDDPVEHFLQHIKHYPGLPNRTIKIDGKKVALDEDIYQQYAVDAGSKLKTWLDESIGLKTWQYDLKSDDGINRLVNKISSKHDKFRYQARKKAIKAQKLRR